MGSYTYQAFEQDAQGLYDHLIEIRKFVQPEELLVHFNELLIEGTCDRAPDVLAKVDRLLASPWAEQEFAHVFNRCCYILINQWWSHADLQGFIRQLMELLTVSSGASNSTLRGQLLSQFQGTDQFDLLNRRAKVMGDREQLRLDRRALLSELIPRYPTLYPYCLLDGSSSQIDRHAVRQLQEVKSRQFEHELLSYGTVILGGDLRSLPQLHLPKADFAADLVQLKNPTLLSDRDLELAIRQFSGKVEGDRTYRDSAQSCLQALDRTYTYRQLKHSVYDYLTDSIQQSSKPLFGRYRFDAWLSEQISQIQPQNHDQVSTSFLLVRTCSQLLDALVANPKTNPSNHIVFVDLVSNFGASFVMGMLLKLLLLCRDFKSHLVSLEARVAQRLSDLFKHYESCAQAEVHWLVDCLDNWMVASCIHFGPEDFQRWEYLV
jgi:hypothetical protein